MDLKDLPPIPVNQPPPITPMINPLQTVFTEKPLKIDECDFNLSNESGVSLKEPSLPYKLQLKCALGSLTAQKWLGHREKKYILLWSRILFLIYGIGILILQCRILPISTVFTSFSRVSWIIMLLYLILSIFVSIKSPKISFWLSSTGIILYTLFGTYALCTPIPSMIKIILNSPESTQSWIVELSLGSFGLIVQLFEMIFNQIQLSYLIMPVIIALNSLIWASLLTINAFVNGSVGEAFPWMSAYIIPGAIICFSFPVLTCWIVINGSLHGVRLAS